MRRLHRTVRRSAAGAILAGVVVACSTEPSPISGTSAPPSASTGARLGGTVTLDGGMPPPEIIRLDADPQCAALTRGEDERDPAVLLGAGQGVQNVFVYLQRGVDAPASAPPPTPVVLDQQRCQYVPRVLGVQVGQRLIIRNSDPLLHTVRADARVNKPFNVATPVQGIEIARSWDAPEVMVPIGCDMHPWMHAYVGVMPHPYFAVTDADGRFAIEGVPPGTYTVAIWHERLGTRAQEIVVAGDDAEALAFVYGASGHRP